LGDFRLILSVRLIQESSQTLTIDCSYAFRMVLQTPSERAHGVERHGRANSACLARMCNARPQIAGGKGIWIQRLGGDNPRQLAFLASECLITPRFPRKFSDINYGIFVLCAAPCPEPPSSRCLAGNPGAAGRTVISPKTLPSDNAIREPCLDHIGCCGNRGIYLGASSKA
jgi:hypothetical protein